MTRLLLISAAAVAMAGCGGGGGDEKPTSASELKPASAARGKTVYAQSGCAACHTFSGLQGRGRSVGPDVDLVAAKYDAAFIRKSIVDPLAFLEKGSEGKIGGSRSYSDSMPAYGPSELPPQQLTEQQLRDLVAFIEEGGKK